MEQFVAWPPYRESTKQFKLLYERITEQLQAFAGGLSPKEERRWFLALINEFHAAFLYWEFDPRMRLALSRIDSVSNQAFRVTAHVYIHIAYDLPRCIAKCLRDRPKGLGARDAYLRARDPLCDTFEAACTEPRIFGHYAFAFRLWRKIPLLKEFPFGIWASDIRERAFGLAEQLLVSTSFERDEVLLWRSIERKLRDAQQRKNPFAWLKVLSPPDLPNPTGPDSLDLVKIIPYADEVEIVYSDEPTNDSDDFDD